MNSVQMRTELSKIYGPSWAAKVKKMSDIQVQAVYLRLKSKGIIK